MSMKFDDEKPEAYAWRMNIVARLEKIDADIAAMKLDLAILKANSATKSDLAEAKSSIITEFIRQLISPSGAHRCP